MNVASPAGESASAVSVSGRVVMISAYAECFQKKSIRSQAARSSSESPAGSSARGLFTPVMPRCSSASMSGGTTHGMFVWMPASSGGACTPSMSVISAPQSPPWATNRV